MCGARGDEEESMTALVKLPPGNGDWESIERGL